MDTEFFNDNERVTKLINQAKDVFSPKDPYEIIHTPTGFKVVFNESFLDLCREAESTGDMSKMNYREKQVYKEYKTSADEPEPTKSQVFAALGSAI